MLVTRPLAADLDLLALHRMSPSRYPVLLESTSSGLAAAGAQGRWDLLLATDGESLQLTPGGKTRDHAGNAVDGDFLSALDAQWRAQNIRRE